MRWHLWPTDRRIFPSLLAAEGGEVENGPDTS
jgi:hypothetical protein